jgi:primosomal protein N' (replication factor Y)
LEASPAGRIVRVVPDVPAIHRRFDYSVPDRLASHIGVGARVRIELHGRRVGGWVVEDDVGPTPGVSPKPIAASSGAGPPPPVVALAAWAAWRWAGPVSSFLRTASPNRTARIRGPATRPGDGHRPPSPGGGSVAIMDDALAEAADCSVVRLAPALDATLVVLELLHRLGSASVLVLAPSHGRADQVAARLAAVGLPVALLPDQWEDAATGTRVVVGTRVGAWAPLSRLRAAVVLDAQDEAYREERAPTWSAVDVVVERGRRDRSPVILVSPCPPVTLAEGRRSVITTRTIERRGWPLIEVVDRTGDDPRTGLFSERLVRAVRSGLERPEARVVCILNRTGRIRLLACAHCGALARCARCGGPVVQNQAADGLRCRRCGESRPEVCAVCDSTRLKSLRIGVTRAVEELSALAGVEATEITAGTPPGEGAAARLVVGTEAALHRVSRAGLVAFLDIDQHLLAPRFAAGEETLTLVARAARLVGGRDAGGRVLVQTRIPEHPALLAAGRADPDLLARPERRLREELGLPPFGALALLGGPGGADFAEGLEALHTLEVSSMGDDRWLVRAPDHVVLCDALAAVPRPTGRLRVEVDPTDT